MLLAGELTDEQAKVAIAKLLFLRHEDPRAPVTVVIDSPGGSVVAALAIYDLFRDLECLVATCATGQAVGTAAMLLCAGAPGHRTALERTRLAMAPIWSDSPVPDEELRRVRAIVYEVVSHHTGQTRRQVEAAFDPTLELTPEEAVSWGLIDRVASGLP